MFVITLGLIALISATVIIAGVWLAPRLSRGDVRFYSEPDLPVSFGPDMAWLAIKTEDTKRVAEILRLSDVKMANWSSGVGTTYDGELNKEFSFIYVTPPVAGWTLVVGTGLPQLYGKAFLDRATPLWKELSQTFSDVHAFCSFPDFDFFSWACFRNGVAKRVYAVNDNGIVCNIGRVSKAERVFGINRFELRGVRGRKGDTGGKILLYPTENHVMQIARSWSLDPTRLEQMGETMAPTFGLIGKAPNTWSTGLIEERTAA